MKNTVIEKPYPLNLYKDITNDRVPPEDVEGTVEYVLTFLKPTHRQIMLMRYRDGLEFRKIGEIVGLSGARIEKICSTCVSYLRDDRELKKYLSFGVKQYAEIYAKFKMRGLEGRRSYNSNPEAVFDYETTTVDELGLSTRAYKALHNQNIFTVKKLIMFGDRIQFIRNLGELSYIEILERLNEYGVDVKKAFPRTYYRYAQKLTLT